jgi:ACS family glucarate transporter-like MFS transporter
MSVTGYATPVIVDTGPTRTRYRVVAFCVALAGVTYLDRNCISILAPQIQEDLGLSRIQMGWVFTSFAIAYAAFEIPSAWWGQKIGTRRVLTRIVAWWSIFTMATAAVFNYPSILITRFLFGAGEAGAWPNAARTFSLWIPGRERGRVQGVFFAGAFLVGGLTPLLVWLFEPLLGWRGVFLLFGCVGFVWAAAWYRWFRDDPTQHSGVNEAEVELIVANRVVRDHHPQPGALARLARNGSAWALPFRASLAYFSNSYGSYFVMTWLPSYLVEARGFASTELALFAGLPLVLSAGSALAGGVITDFLSQKFGLQIGRTGVGVVGYAIAGGAMLMAANAQEARSAAVILAVAFAFSMIPLASHWACAIEIGRDNAGVLGGTMNTVGQVGSLTSPLIAAFLVDRFSNWALPLYVMAGLYAFSAICWLVMRLRP